MSDLISLFFRICLYYRLHKIKYILELTSYELFLCYFRITGCIGSSFLAIGLFSINKLTWTWSVSAEVFSLNNLLVAALMLTAVLFEADDEPRHVEKVNYIYLYV